MLSNEQKVQECPSLAQDKLAGDDDPSTSLRTVMQPATNSINNF
jgi:hypothetical protein